MDAQTDGTVPLRHLLANVSEEFLRMADEIEQLQGAVSGILQATAGVDNRLLVEAQALDRVFQHLGQLGDIIAITARHCPAGWRVSPDPILCDVSLSSLVHRLRGTEADSSESGELEVF